MKIRPKLQRITKYATNPDLALEDYILIMALALFFILVIQVCISNTNPCYSTELPKFTTVLVSGDSTVDTGNNN